MRQPNSWLLVVSCMALLAPSIAFLRPPPPGATPRARYGDARLGRLGVSLREDSELVEVKRLPGEALAQGCVLVANPHEYNHFTNKGCLFLFKHDERGSAAVILEKPTAFSLGELSPELFSASLFANNTVFLGGDVSFSHQATAVPFECLRAGRVDVAGGR
jgi:hypothetical protein